MLTNTDVPVASCLTSLLSQGTWVDGTPANGSAALKEDEVTSSEYASTNFMSASVSSYVCPQPCLTPGAPLYTRIYAREIFHSSFYLLLNDATT